MRATRAYITSFGTTGLLIAAVLLTLAVMSAFVAFNGFPGQDVQDPIGTLLVQQRQAPVSLPAKPVHTDVLASKRSIAASASATRHSSARHTRAPLASTGPVTQGTPAETSPPQGQETTASPNSTPALQPTAPISTPTTPSVPNTAITVPQVTLPSLPPPPSAPSAPSNGSPLPIDTSGITGTLNP